VLKLDLRVIVVAGRVIEEREKEFTRILSH
jgi:hypothetical protein